MQCDHAQPAERHIYHCLHLTALDLTRPATTPSVQTRTPTGFPPSTFLELDVATLALAAAANAPMSQRAVTFLMIASIVASGNGIAFLLEIATPAALMPMVTKDKKTAKGHFTAPPHPTMVLRPQALVTAACDVPTPNQWRGV